MLKKNNILTSVLVILFCFGLMACGQKQINKQMRDTAYIKFQKSLYKGYRISINDTYDFTLEPCIRSHKGQNKCNNKTANTLYEVKSGNISIKVNDISSEKLVLHKEMYLGSSNTTEIVLP